MRFHVVGVGSIGSLVAFHLRRILLPHHHSVVLILKEKYQSLAEEHGRKFSLAVEKNGETFYARGFDTEVMYPSSFRLTSRRELRQDEAMPYEEPEDEYRSKELDLPSGPPELVNDENKIESLFVACKAYSTVDVLGQLQPRLTPESTVVLFQNGVLAVYEKLIEEVFSDAESRPNFVLVSNNHGAYRTSSFRVSHAGMGRMRLGIVPNGRRDFERTYYNADILPSRRQLSLDDIAYPDGGDTDYYRYRSLRNTITVLQNLPGLNTSWEPFRSLQIHLRQKLTVNCVINPLTTLLECKNGKLFKYDRAHHLAQRICWEAEKVFKEETRSSITDLLARKQMQVHPALQRDNLLKECENVAAATSKNTSSMLADYQTGNGLTEIDYLNGYLVKLGKRYNAGTQVNSALVDLVKLRMKLRQSTKRS